MDYTIRKEMVKDYREVEELTKLAFWNLHTPGCNEHYLAHIIRNHADFVKDLSLVIEKNNRIIGNIMYTKSSLIDENNNKEETLTFGPVSILPEFQRKGYGSKLIKHSFEIAKNMGYKTIVIYGHPRNYVNLGFKSCKRFNICIENGIYPTALLVKSLNDEITNNRRYYIESDAYNIYETKFEEFDSSFIQLEKKETLLQEEFYIYSNSQIL